jgi:hypothetical protein
MKEKKYKQFIVKKKKLDSSFLPCLKLLDSRFFFVVVVAVFTYDSVFNLLQLACPYETKTNASAIA